MAGGILSLYIRRDVYKAAIPSGMKLESETLVEYNPDFEATAPLPEKEQKILDLLSRDTEQCVTQLEKKQRTEKCVDCHQVFVGQRGHLCQGGTET